MDEGDESLRNNFLHVLAESYKWDLVDQWFRFWPEAMCNTWMISAVCAMRFKINCVVALNSFKAHVAASIDGVGGCPAPGYVKYIRDLIVTATGNQVFLLYTICFEEIGDVVCRHALRKRQAGTGVGEDILQI